MIRMQMARFMCMSVDTSTHTHKTFSPLPFWINKLVLAGAHLATSDLKWPSSYETGQCFGDYCD